MAKNRTNKTGKKKKSILARMASDSFQIRLISLMLPILAMLCVFAGNRIYPFGDRSFLRTDLYHQYAPFFANFQQKLQGGKSLFYTWDIGMGTNFLTLIGYYLSSFFNFPVVLFPEGLILEYISYLVILKMGLAGLGFTFLLENHTDHADYKIPIFSLFYAMSGYLAAYSWNIMWLDCIWLAPIILLGIEKLVKEKKWGVYVISLAVAIASNYYIAIMLCMFCVLYFIVQVTDLCFDAGEDVKGRTFLMAAIRFAWTSVLAGALAAFILLPEVKALSMTASSDITFPKSWTQYFTIFEMLGRHLMDVAIENGLDHWPNIYCGVGVLLCIPLYYMNKKCRTSEKITRTALLFFMLFSFSMNVPNFIWHGFHYPNSLPCRQSFLYIAIVLIMCYEAVEDLSQVTSKMVGSAFFIGAGFILFAQQFLDDDAYGKETFWLSLLFVGLYAAMLLFVLKFKRERALMFVFILLTATIESLANMAVTSVTTVSRNDYLSNRESYRELINTVNARDPGFHRFEKVARHTKNDGAFIGYPSISTFSSVSYGDLQDFYKNLGMESSMNAYSNNGITPLMNSIFAVKYILTTTSQQESQLMTLCEQNENTYLYENLYTLSAGFMLPQGFNVDWDTSFGKPIYLQNEFASLLGYDDLFVEIEDVESFGDSMTITPPDTCHAFLQVSNSRIDNVTVKINDDDDDYSHVKRGFLIDLGYISPDDEIEVSTKDDDEDMEASVYYLNEEVFIEMIKDLREEELQVTEWKDTSLAGNIDVKEKGLFFLSVPYDTGWKISVDGKQIPYYEFQDSFICFDLDAGSHEINMIYTPDGFYLGCIISASALVLLLLLLWMSKKKILFFSPFFDRITESAVEEEVDHESKYAPLTGSVSTIKNNRNTEELTKAESVSMIEKGSEAEELSIIEKGSEAEHVSKTEEVSETDSLTIDTANS